MLPPPVAAAAPAATLERYAGRYELANNQMITFVVADGHFYSSSDGLPDEEFIPLGAGHFASADRPVRFAVTSDLRGGVTGLTWSQGGRDRPVPRIGPLVHTLTRSSDEDRALTAKVEAALSAMARGDSATLAAASALTPQTRHDFSRGPWPPAVGRRSLTYVARQSAVSPNIERHGGVVDSIVYYTLTTDSGVRTLLVYLTREGLITDFDVVAD